MYHHESFFWFSTSSSDTSILSAIDRVDNSYIIDLIDIDTGEIVEFVNEDIEKNNEQEKKDHQVIHKKDGRLHIYVRQDKYKGELKSKNWVGRLYIDGKQKISSSGTQNLNEAIPILEKWFDDIHAESEKLKKLAEAGQQTQDKTQEQPSATTNTTEEKPNPTVSTTTSEEIKQNISTTVESAVNNDVTLNHEAVKKTEESVDAAAKSKVSNILGKFKNLKFKKLLLF